MVTFALSQPHSQVPLFSRLQSELRGRAKKTGANAPLPQSLLVYFASQVSRCAVSAPSRLSRKGLLAVYLSTSFGNKWKCKRAMDGSRSFNSVLLVTGIFFVGIWCSCSIQAIETLGMSFKKVDSKTLYYPTNPLQRSLQQGGMHIVNNAVGRCRT